MNVEIRACRDDEEMEKMAQIISYAFADPIEESRHEVGYLPPEDTLCAFVDGEMATSFAAYPFTVRLNGNPVAMAGVTQVGTLPEFRRTGLLRKVMTQAFEQYHDEGRHFAILTASMAAIYQRFGYGLVSDFIWYTFDPRGAGLREPPERGGSTRLMPKEEAMPLIHEIYAKWAAPRNLAIERGKVMWEGKVTHSPKGPLYYAVYRDDTGEPAGYSIFSTKYIDSPDVIMGPDQEMTVRDLIALDITGWKRLWEYVRNHDLVGRIRMTRAIASDDPAWQLLLEPRLLHRRHSDNIWMRIVDIEHGLAARPYGDAGSLAIRIVEDAICPWNEGTFLLETDGANAAVRRTDAEPDLTLSPRVLAQLVAGYTTATSLARLGELESSSARILRRADRIFATEHAPHCADGF